MTGSMMGFPQTSNTVVGNTGGALHYDGTFGRLYGVDAGSSSTDGIRTWDAYPNGLELRARNIGDLNVVSLYLQSALTFHSNELVINSGASNSSELFGFSGYDLSATSSFGTISSSLAASGGLRILSPQQIVAWQLFGYDMLAAVSIVGGAKEVDLVNWGTKYCYGGTITQTNAVLGSVPDGSGSVVYALGWNGNSTAMELYNITSTASINPVGSFLPTAIDATWTNCTTVYGITVDQTDGNLILAFATTDVVTNHYYIAKINATTATVVWKVPVTALATNINDFSKNTVKNGTFYYIDGTNLYTINTKTGAATNVAFTSVSITFQITEDVSGSIIWYGNWSDTASVNPTYIGNYCGTLGNHSGNNIVWRYWPVLAAGNAPVYAPPASSRKRAWFFVLDGHEMYVLDLGAEGTWIYDKSTNQWCEFITQGFVQWNFANGSMWGQRIVAGDLLSTEVWEMQPSFLFDNGATEIQHVVTGGVAIRSRVYHSVDSFRLACSSGQYTDPSGAGTVTLFFSDDQGQTYTQMDTYTLPAGAFTHDFNWNSLGSFAAPGRIFKIVDTGGFLRIDGADAGIDGFDPITGDDGSGGQGGGQSQ